MSKIETFKIIDNSNHIKIGKVFNEFIQSIDYLDVDERPNIESSSYEILSNCLPASNIQSHKSNTGIVIGKVQSGKTLSITSLCALARDNSYKLIVVISGRQRLLLTQTIDRLKSDLTNKFEDLLIFENIKNQKRKISYRNRLKKILNKSNKTIIIPILKHQNWIYDLSEIFNSLSDDLTTNTVLVIDDEADQASLNTLARYNRKNETNKESAIYSSIKSLKNSLPSHSYIQYTATPQANLLIDSLDLLKPSWHVLLNTSKYYTGGQEFIDNKLYRVIKQEGDFPPLTKHLESPPESLSYILRKYLLVVALIGDGISNKQVFSKKTSMLIHPTWKVNDQEDDIGIMQFESWVKNIINQYAMLINEGHHEIFNDVYDELNNKFNNSYYFNRFPSLEELLSDVTDNVIDELEIHAVVGGYLGNDEEFPWDLASHHILIGGQLLDRGFTIKNLVYTYMPRDTKGKNQSDTIEQRCRFFGYRKDFLPFCEVHLTNGLVDDYIKYNEFENELFSYLSKNSLEDFYKNGSKMLMSKNLIPTNQSRISDDIISTQLSGYKYFEPQILHHENNSRFINDFLTKLYDKKILKPKNHEHAEERPASTHYVYETSVSSILDLINVLEFDNEKDELLSRLIDRHAHYQNFLNLKAYVINISPLKTKPRDRGLELVESTKYSSGKHLKFKSLLQGDFKFKDNETYFSDRSLLIQSDEYSSQKFNYENELIVQVHHINILPFDKSVDKNIKLLEGKIIKTIAFYFPEKWSERYISKVK